MSSLVSRVINCIFGGEAQRPRRGIVWGAGRAGEVKRGDGEGVAQWR